MLCNGYGEHNIQGIGDKHIPLIHNVMNTDVVSASPILASDSLNVLFGGNVGRAYLAGTAQARPDADQGLRRHRHHPVWPTSLPPSSSPGISISAPTTCS